MRFLKPASSSPRLLALSFFILAAGCGKVDEQDEENGTTPPAVTPPAITPQCHARTAPLLAIEGGVETRNVTTSPCGDVLFQKKDASVWLRTSDGVLTQLAAKGSIGTFDAAGTLVSFKKNEEGFVRDLTLGTEISTGSLARFAVDPSAGKSIAFVCSNEGGIRVLHGSTLGSVIASTESLRCGDHSPLGPTVIAYSETGSTLAFVDLAREKLTLAEGIEYRRNGSFPNSGQSSRRDSLRLSRNGGVALYQATTWTGCGDTECPKSDSLDVIETRGGKTAAHLATGHIAYLEQPKSDLIRERANALVDKDADYSIDTTTGVLTSRKDATLVQIQDDGTLVLSRWVNGTSSVVLTKPGESTESPWFTTANKTPVATSLAASPSGRRALVLPPTNSIHVTNSPSTWGGSEYGDLILRDGDREIARHKWFTGFTAVAFPADGSIIFEGTTYIKEPPSEAESLTGLLEGALYRIAPDGALTKLGPYVGATTRVLEVSDTVIASLARSYDGHTSSSTMTIYDLASGGKRIAVQSAGIEDASTVWEKPSGLVAVIASTDDGSSTTLWHGVP